MRLKLSTKSNVHCAPCYQPKASDIRFEREVDSGGTRVAPRAKASRAFVASLCPDCIATTMALMAMAESARPLPASCRYSWTAIG